MVRNKSYTSFIQSNAFQYKSGDMMVLYTDGITEAKDGKGEEFGYDRLVDCSERSRMVWLPQRFKIT